MIKGTVAARLEAMMKEKNIKARALAEAAGVGQTYVRDILAGRSINPSPDKLGMIAEALGCSLYALSGNKKHIRNDEKIKTSADEGVVYIPEYNIEVSAGVGCSIPDMQDASKVWRIPREVLAGIQATSLSNLAIVTVRGDSMEPDYRPYEKILVDRGDTLIRNDGVYILSNGIDLVVKMVQVLAPESGQSLPSLRIISKNPDYPAYERPFQDVMVNGRVVGKWTWK